MLEKYFTELLDKYNVGSDISSKLWLEVEDQHSGKKKYYHNLTHLENMLAELLEVKSEIKDWQTILFSLFYHDIIYSAVKGDNELQSAELAGKRLTQIGVSDVVIKKCKSQILATKTHALTEDSDTNIFIDADLSILGKSWETYTDYYQNIRKENSIFPDMIYNAGRRKLLKNFLAMDKIYKTALFSEKYENQAKLNIFKELRLL